MKITSDRSAGMTYIYFEPLDRAVAKTVERDGVVFDYDAEGGVVGIELYDVPDSRLIHDTNDPDPAVIHPQQGSTITFTGPWASIGDLLVSAKEPSVQSVLPCPDIWVEVAAERERAHQKHRETSMEQQPVDALLRLSILMEEVGEVAKEMNDARHYGHLDHAALRSELVQVAAMAGAWAAALTAIVEREAEEHRMSVCRWCDHDSGMHNFSHGYGQDSCNGCDCTGYAAPLPPVQSAGSTEGAR